MLYLLPEQVILIIFNWLRAFSSTSIDRLINDLIGQKNIIELPFRWKNKRVANHLFFSMIYNWWSMLKFTSRFYIYFYKKWIRKQMKSCRSKKLAQAFNSIDFIIDCDAWAQWHHYSITLREMLENALNRKLKPGVEL